VTQHWTARSDSLLLLVLFIGVEGSADPDETVIRLGHAHFIRGAVHGAAAGGTGRRTTRRVFT